MQKLFNSIHTKLSTLRNSEGVKYKKTMSIAFLPHGICFVKWVGVGTTVLGQAWLSGLTALHAHTYARN